MRNDPKVAAERYSALKTFSAGLICGLIVAWAGVTLSAGRFSAVSDRVGKVWHVLSTDEPSTTVAP